MQLTVMVDNIEYEGGPATDEAMRVVDADIVGVLESYNRLPEIARKTGYPYYNVALQVLSKFPIHEPSEGDGLYGLVEVRPGEVVAVFNVHLDYVKRGRNKLLAGMELDDVIALENEVRTSALEVQVDAMTRLIEQGVPVFLTGDFNQPSSLDYTAETVGTRPGIDEPIPWPVSEMLFDLGFRDSYREIHPDPVETPGITHLKSEDRIDYVYAAGPSTTLDSQLVGEEGGPDVEIELPEWTSDHRAVLSTFEVTPAPMPTMVSVNARLQNVGDTITVAYHGAGGEIAIVPEDEDPSAAVATLDAPGDSGTAELETGDLDPTGYDAVLVDDSGAEVARVAFWLRDSEAEVKLSTDKATYAEGEPITVSWEDGPANALAAVALLLWLRFAMIWLGLYLGLVAGKPEAVMTVQILVWPLGFLSNAFSDPGSMPAWLGTIAEWNPLSATVAATRELFGNPGWGGDSWAATHALELAILWPLVLTAVFFPLAVAKYRSLSRELTLEEWQKQPLRSTVLDNIARLTSALQ